TSALARVGENVPHEVDAAALPGGAEHLGDGGLQSLMRVGDDELHPAQSAPGELAQELGPDWFGLRGADLHAQHLATTVGVDADRDDDGDRDDASAAAHLQISCV